MHDLTTRRIDLAEAVESLQKTDLTANPKWRAALRRAYPDVDDRALLAADIVQHAVSVRQRTPTALELAVELERQFAKLYGFKPELPYRQTLHLVPEMHETARHIKP